jgi:hypothetical protein
MLLSLIRKRTTWLLTDRTTDDLSLENSLPTNAKIERDAEWDYLFINLDQRTLRTSFNSNKGHAGTLS